eukprot:g45766.t1
MDGKGQLQNKNLAKTIPRMWLRTVANDSTGASDKSTTASPHASEHRGEAAPEHGTGSEHEPAVPAGADSPRQQRRGGVPRETKVQIPVQHVLLLLNAGEEQTGGWSDVGPLLDLGLVPHAELLLDCNLKPFYYGVTSF